MTFPDRFNRQFRSGILRSAIAVCVMFLYSNALRSQIIYLCDSNNWLYEFDLHSCDYQFLCAIGDYTFDITFHPNGNLYGISPDGRLFRLDPSNCAMEVIHQFDDLWYNFNSMVASSDGKIYVAAQFTEDDGVLWSIDLSTSPYVAVRHGALNFGPAGDLTFYNGDLYMAATDDRIIKINLSDPEASEVVIDQLVPGSIFGIVSFSEDCSDITSYAITDGRSDIYLIDFESASLTYVCEINIEVAGGASTYEFAGSAPVYLDSVVTIAPLCNGQKGQITIYAHGGIDDLVYSINGGPYGSSNVFTDLEAGAFEFMVTDGNGCVLPVSVTLALENSPSLVTLGWTDETCGHQNGAIDIITEGGNGMVLYSIDNINFQKSGHFENLLPGLYTIYIIDSLGCQLTEQVTITAQPALLLEEIEIESTSCGGANGSIAFHVLSGTLPFTYILNETTTSSSGTFSEISAGTYTYVVHDASHCSVEGVVTIPVSHPILLHGIDTESETCDAGNAVLTVFAESDTSWIQYSLDGIDYQDENMFDSLQEGIYSVWVRDTFGCIETGMVMIENSSAPGIAELIVTQPSCGIPVGSLEIQGSGEEIFYSLNGSPLQSGGQFADLGAGIYIISVHNMHGCFTEDTVVINEILQSQCNVFIPNVFSPNGDGINDVFGPLMKEDFTGKVNEFTIYNRWGAVIHDVSDVAVDDPALFWNGEDEMPAVFTYVLKLILDDGEVEVISGDVTLVR